MKTTFLCPSDSSCDCTLLSCCDTKHLTKLVTPSPAFVGRGPLIKRYELLLIAAASRGKPWRNPWCGRNRSQAEVSGPSRAPCEAHGSRPGLSRSLDQNTVTWHRHLPPCAWDAPLLPPYCHHQLCHHQLLELT